MLSIFTGIFIVIYIAAWKKRQLNEGPPADKEA
jgi:hypothetical protein